MTNKPKWYKELRTLPFHEGGFQEHFRHQVLQKVESKRASKKNSSFFYPVISLTTLALCIVVVFQLNPTTTSNTPNPGIDGGLRHISGSLNEEMWHVNAIVSGNVLDTTDTELLDASMNTKINYSGGVTPAIIQVDEVLYGEITTPTITLLQHGDPSDPNASLVNTGEELVLILVKTTNGDYWAYDEYNGIWTIEEGKVEAPHAIQPMDKLNGVDVNTFKKQVAKAAENKKKPSGLK